MTAALLLALLVGQAPEPARRAYVLAPARSSVRFRVVHPLHAVDGRANHVEAKAVVEPDGVLKAMARIQAASLDTGDANRDVNLRAALEADRFPYVVVRGTGTLVVPAAVPAELPLRLTAELDLHGVKRTFELPLDLAFEAGGDVRARGRFDVSLDAHGVERPSLLLRKIDDRCRIELDLAFEPDRS
jgi:polyisoprenoid-binding protein YceI